MLLSAVAALLALQAVAASVELQQVGPACAGESHYSSHEGSFDVSPIRTYNETLECSFLIDVHNDTYYKAGITFTFGMFRLTGEGGCFPEESYLRIYDGATRFAPLLADFSCENAYRVASRTGTVLLVLYASAQHASDGVRLSWAPSQPACGNDVCEPSADEYTACRADCVDKLPSVDAQYRDTKYCRNGFDTITAVSDGNVQTIEFTRAHFGQPLPANGARYTLAGIANPKDACATLPQVNNSAFELPTALLADVYKCHFIDKGVNLAGTGVSLGVVEHTDASLFYMASPASRLLDARALDIPVLLVDNSGGTWLRQRVQNDITIIVGSDSERRCSGEKQLRASSSSLSSNPAGTDYCSWQDCAWLISIPDDDVIVLSFSRFDVECVVSASGPYDYVRVHDGATESAPLLGTFHCSDAPTVVSSGRNLFVLFHSDSDFSFGGFEAQYTTARSHCAAFEHCGDCSAAAACAWCKETASCQPQGLASSVCEAEAVVSSADLCCSAGFGGDDCAECATGFYGLNCTACDCVPGSNCNDGRAGDGGCQCSSETEAGESCPCSLQNVLYGLKLQVSSECESRDCSRGSMVDPRTVYDGRSFPTSIQLRSSDLWVRANFSANTSAVSFLGNGQFATTADEDGLGEVGPWPLKLGNNALVFSVALPGQSSPCDYTAQLVRPAATDTSLASAPTYVAFDRYNQAVTQQIGFSAVPQASCEYETCYQAVLSKAWAKLRVQLSTRHSSICGLSSHACANMMDVSTQLRGGVLFDGGNLVGEKGSLDISVRPPVGASDIIVTVTAEDGSTGKHQIRLNRRPSNDATLSRVSFQGGTLGKPFRPEFDRDIWVRMLESATAAQIVGTRLLLVTAKAAHAEECSGTPVPYCKDPPNVVTVQGNSDVDVPLLISKATTQATITVVAEDFVTTRNYSLTITCSFCGEQRSSGNSATDSSTPPVASVWLLLVLLTATLLLCAISACFCFRIHCMRAARRGAVHASIASANRVSGEQVLQALSSCLVEVKAEGLEEEACAICLCDMNDEEPLNALPCRHIFHAKCIRGWITHKGVTSSCPLCKRLVDAQRQAALQNPFRQTGVAPAASTGEWGARPVAEQAEASSPSSVARAGASVSHEEASGLSSANVQGHNAGSEVDLMQRGMVQTLGHASSVGVESVGDDIVGISSPAVVAPPDETPPSSTSTSSPSTPPAPPQRHSSQPGAIVAAGEGDTVSSTARDSRRPPVSQVRGPGEAADDLAQSDSCSDIELGAPAVTGGSERPRTVESIPAWVSDVSE